MKIELITLGMMAVMLSGLLTLNSSNKITATDVMNYQQDQISIRIDHTDGTSEYRLVKNVVTNVGLNYSRDRIWYINRAPNSSVMDFLAIANGTAPSAASTSLNSEIVGCGLGRSQSTLADQPSNGNITLSYKWTMNSSCSNVLINTTGTFNASSSGTLLGAGTFVTATLQPNDNITVNHNYKLS